jgi:hypothetical protein
MNMLLHAFLIVWMALFTSGQVSLAGNIPESLRCARRGHMHIYLYAHGNPVNGTDPSGHEFSMTGSISAAGNAISISTRVASGVWQGYEKAQWLKDGVQIAYKTIGSGTVDPVTMGLWLSDFIPLRKVSQLFEKVGSFTGLGRHLTDVMGGIKGIANNGKEQIGHLAANAVARARGLQITSFRPRGNGGFDDVFKDKDGFFVIVEAKAGLNPRLNPAAGMNPAQMSQAWIEKNVRGIAGQDPSFAQELLNAFNSNPKRIRGMVVSTKIDANGRVFDPDWEVKDWGEIGIGNW